jgi:ABC-type polysaccharide/polyol phosphate export permease
VRYTINFLVQIWLFATPVAYSSSIVPEKWRVFYALNPMVGVVDGFRWALLGKPESPGVPILVSVIVVCLLLAGGLYYFRPAGATVCRYCLMSNLAIRCEGLSKQYRIGSSQQLYKTLRDAIT